MSIGENRESLDEKTTAADREGVMPIRDKPIRIFLPALAVIALLAIGLIILFKFR